ncbi:MAG TPA: hypothetical protein VI837_06780 [Blastocatellia bacterium]|nr:hypothetical protein [Blastocatellia bacterium]
MTQEEFADQLRQWKQELVDEVIAYYRNDEALRVLAQVPDVEPAEHDTL